jgi:hypothetical protein
MNFHVRLIALLLFALSWTACDPSAGTPGATVPGEVHMAATSQEGTAAEPAGEDAQGTVFEVDAARVNVRHIEFQLPDGMRCDDLDLDELSGEDSSDDGSDDSSDDDGSDDSSDDGSDDSGDDDGSDGDSTDDDSTDDSVGRGGSCSEDKIRFEGPWVVNLIERTSEPALTDLRLPPLTYKRVDLRFDDADPDHGLVSPDDLLAENTMVIEGGFSYGGEDATYRVSLRFNEDARFEHPDGIPVDEDASSLLLTLDVGQWFTSASITECLNEGELEIIGGHMELNDETGDCGSVENEIKEAIKRSGQLDRLDD